MHVRPAFEPWAIWQLAVISLLAGVCEEVFFRGVLQGGLARHIGTIPSLAVCQRYLWPLSSGDKDLCRHRHSHPGVSRVLWLAAGNLLAPIAAHAVYDLVALIYFLRAHVRPHRPAKEKGSVL